MQNVAKSVRGSTGTVRREAFLKAQATSPYVLTQKLCSFANLSITETTVYTERCQESEVIPPDDAGAQD